MKHFPIRNEDATAVQSASYDTEIRMNLIRKTTVIEVNNRHIGGSSVRW